MITAFPKPHPRPLYPKPMRLPEGKAVTIGIGFVAKGGVVIAADRQMTVERYYKDHEAKMTIITHPNCHVVSTYAYLPSLANILNDRVDLALRTIHRPYGEEIVELLRDEFAKLKKQYPTETKSQQFLWAISTATEPARLLRISGGILDEPRWACIGIGDSSLVRYIVSQLSPISPAELPPDDVARLTVYILKQAKTFVDGCGGPTDAAVLYDDSEIRPIEEVKSEEIEKEFESMQFAFRYLYAIWTSSSEEGERHRLMDDLSRFVKEKLVKPPKP